jgi:SynChlorMet cassette radical SAM/SPASM protein ScmE
MLQCHDVPVAVRVTIHRQNVEHLEDIVHLLLDELGLPAFSTNAAGYLGACRQNAGGILLRTSEREMAMETLLRLSETYNHRITAQAGPLAEVRHWQQMEKARLQNASAFPRGGHLTACGCPMEKIAVRADGVFVPCSMLPHIELGRINQDSLAEIWQQNAELNQLRQRQTISLTQFEFCDDCAYVPYCTGNCPGLAYSLTGQVDHPSPDACLRRFLEDGGAIPSLESMS